jgi:ankyrin repeat protein
LLRYAAKAWFYHSALQNERDVDREVSLLQQKRARSDWLLIYQPDVVL